MMSTLLRALRSGALAGSPARLRLRPALRPADPPADPPAEQPAEQPGGKGAARPGWLRRSLTTSVSEGMLAEMVVACTSGAVLTAWGLHLGFGQGMVGLLCALPFAANIFHLPAALLTERIGRRRLSLYAIGLSRLCWLALPLLLTLEPAQARAGLVAILVVSSILGVLGNNAWTVWMGELLPPSMQGRYFGRRTALLTIAGSVVSFFAGIGLDRARLTGHTEVALSALAIGAGVGGLACAGLLARQRERRRARREPRPLMATLMAPFRDPAMRPLLTYQLAWNAAVGVASSFFVVYLVRDLGFSFAFVAAHAAVAAGARTVAAPFWGKAIDRVGPERVLLVSGLGIAVVPLLWILGAPDRLWPLAVDAVVWGALSAGHGLALFGLPLRVAPRDSLPSYVGALSSVAGGAFAATCLLGGLLAARLPSYVVLGGHTHLALDVLFLVATVIRVGAACLAWSVIRSGEPRGVGPEAPQPA